MEKHTGEVAVYMGILAGMLVVIALGIVNPERIRKP